MSENMTKRTLIVLNNRSFTHFNVGKVLCLSNEDKNKLDSGGIKADRFFVSIHSYNEIQVLLLKQVRIDNSKLH